MFTNCKIKPQLIFEIHYKTFIVYDGIAGNFMPGATVFIYNIVLLNSIIFVIYFIKKKKT